MQCLVYTAGHFKKRRGFDTFWGKILKICAAAVEVARTYSRGDINPEATSVSQAMIMRSSMPFTPASPKQALA